MKCEWVRENITLHVYGELADDARHELEQHVARCVDCAAELKAEQEFHALLEQGRAADPLLGDPSPNLLAASRMRLQEGLETVKQGSFFSRLAFDPANWLLQMKVSPALAEVILIFGFAGGGGATYEIYGSRHPDTTGVASVTNPTNVPEAPVASISSIVQDPNTNQV